MKKLPLLGLLALLLVYGALAQDDTRPTIAMLRFGGPAGNPTFVEVRIISMLESYGYISAEEAAVLGERGDLEGENINVYWGDAGWDFANASLMVETALDQEADVLVTITTPAARAAVNLTLDLDDPPLVLSSSLLYPYSAGIAGHSCIKPDHLIGAVVEVPVERLFSLLLAQQPAVQTIGVLAGATEISGSEGAAAIVELAEAHGISAEVATIITQSDALHAAEGLMNKDIEALVTSWDVQISHNMIRINEIAENYGIPVYIPSLPAALNGATFSAGFLYDDKEATGVARLLAGYLAGELDPATTGLLELRGPGTGVNLDALAHLGMTAAPELLEEADMIVRDGTAEFSERYLDALIAGNASLGVDKDREADAALFASLRCTEDMIAEQQAELDAASG